MENQDRVGEWLQTQSMRDPALLLQPSLPVPSKKQIWAHLQGTSSVSLACSECAAFYDGPVVVIAPDTATANVLEKACQFFKQDGHLPITIFPDWEILPFDAFSPHQDIISERLRLLYSIPLFNKGIIIISLATLVQMLPPLYYVGASAFLLKVGETIEVSKLTARLRDAGYRQVEQVFEHGEFSVRGSLFDIFPMGCDAPFRIDREEDTVDSIRLFDPETQCSTGKTNEICVLPAKEFPLDATGIKRFKEEWASVFSGRPTDCPLYQDVTKGFAPPGIEYYLPLFFEKTALFFDYVPQNTLFVFFDSLEASANLVLKEVKERYELLRHDRTRPLLPPEMLFLSTPQVFESLNGFDRVEIISAPLDPAVKPRDDRRSVGITTPPTFFNDKNTKSPFESFSKYVKENPNERILLLAESPGRRERILNLLHPFGIVPSQVENWQTFIASHAQVAIGVASLGEGLVIPGQVTVITEKELFGEAQKPTQKKAPTSVLVSDQNIRHFAELSPGDPIVHTQHGIGRYLGLQNLVVDNEPQEFLTLEYAGGDKLYVPVHAMHLINRYISSHPDTVALHKLGMDRWQKDKEKVEKKIRDVAAELLEIYAKRAEQKRPSFFLAGNDYETFIESFPFEETPDQQKSILEVIADLKNDKPMDRLICGDVGFGKTEVALRAAFIAAQNNKQVAVLVPTTLLAQQHYQIFSDRFANWPVNIAYLSRLGTAKEQQAARKGLETGKIDIVIGTHKLLQSHIRFRSLGLLIIDEEHRFGVSQKEKLKALRGEVDILTLTATPIPRTLHMAMSGIREFSLIATAPLKRLSIKTFVREYQKGLIREAILRELHRGGQVYYLHNDVKTILDTARKIAELVPEARLKVGHGQMAKRDLERVMVDFYHQRFNVLVCTTIIETGLDVPTANTIIIEQADKFGLAQLYQIRGRVGRSHHQAYAYLLTQPEKQLGLDAKKRLAAIAAYEELGSGFMLASHDLEIRGAGELLGAEQSGQMDAVGYSLYMEMLEDAIKTLQGDKKKERTLPIPEINLRIPALFPESYIKDVHTRLLLYKRISSVPSNEALDDLRVELIDRFGKLPEPAQNLLRIHQLKLLAMPFGIKKVEFSAQGGSIEFSPETMLDPQKLIRFIQQNPKSLKLEGRRLKIQKTFENSQEKTKHLEEVFLALA